MLAVLVSGEAEEKLHPMRWACPGKGSRADKGHRRTRRYVYSFFIAVI
jgi:hypothetical protein